MAVQYRDRTPEEREQEQEREVSEIVVSETGDEGGRRDMELDIDQY